MLAYRQGGLQLAPLDFEIVSMNVFQLFHCSQQSAFKFYLCTDFAVLFKHLGNFHYVRENFPVISGSCTNIQFLVNASLKFINGCAQGFLKVFEVKSFSLLLRNC